MGAVYEATDDRLGRAVAIKVILGDQPDGEGRKRFLREAQAASALNHPNIVTVHEVGRDGDIDFIVMERIAGLTLRDTIGSSRLPPRTILEYAAQIAGALAAAHDAGLVHRDLKPGNIMVTPRGLVKVLDFGLALQTAPGESSTTVTSQGVAVRHGVLHVARASPEQGRRFAIGCLRLRLRSVRDVDRAAGIPQREFDRHTGGDPSRRARADRSEHRAARAVAPGREVPAQAPGRPLAAHVGREAAAGGPGERRRAVRQAHLPARSLRSVAAIAGSVGRRS